MLVEALFVGDGGRSAPGHTQREGRGVSPTRACRDRARVLRLGVRRKRGLGGAALALRREEVCRCRQLVRGRGRGDALPRCGQKQETAKNEIITC